MRPLARTLVVKDIRGRQLGTVATVRACCIQFADGRAVQHTAVNTVDPFAIELICDGDQLARYECGMHSPAPAMSDTLAAN